MASSVLIPLKTILDDKGIKDAQKQFGKLGKSLKTAVGALGVGVGLAAAVTGLKDAGKAAVEEAKSQALLANQLRNTVGASEEQIASVEKSVMAMQFQAAVADDVIRPAFASLVRATGDVTAATNLTQLALDVAAGTGKDLSAVSIALGKAYQGNTTALSKLGIKVKEGVNVFDQLSTAFAGAAETAANNDPFQRLSIVLGELQEQMGAIILPLFNDFASFMSSADFSVSVSNLFIALQNVGGQLDVLFKQISGKGALQTIVDLAGAAAVGVAEIVFWLSDLGTTIGYIVTGQWDKAGNQMGTFFTRYNKFVDDIYAQQDKAAAKAGKYTPLASITGVVPAGSKKPSKKSAAELAKEALDKFKESLKKLGNFSDLTTMAKEMGEFESSVTKSFEDIYKKLEDAPKGTKGLAELKSFLNAQKALLVENAKQRDAIIAKRSLAEALINDVKSAIIGVGNLAGLLNTETRQITQSITTIVNGFVVTTRRTFDEVVGGSGIVSRLQNVVQRTRAFAAQLTQLKALGLNPDLFKQIVEAGPDVGGQLATEILSGGADSVAALNSAFTELQTVAGTVAEQTAVVMYNNGVEVAGGLVNGLLSQEQALVDAAKTLADAFNLAYQSQVTALVPEAPKVTPKKGSTIISNTANVTIRTSNDTKSDAQKIIAKVNKFYQSNTGAKVAAGKFVF